MSWIYTEEGLGIFFYGALFWLIVYLMSKWMQRKPMHKRGWFEPMLMLVVLAVVFTGLITTLGVDKRGWR